MRSSVLLWILLSALGVSLLAACARPREVDGYHLRVLPISASAPGGDLPVIYAEVAATREARERGLGGRASLPEDGGMLFVYPESKPREFWMKDCLISLDIAYLAEDGRIASLHTLSKGAGLPHDEIPRAPSKEPARYVLETRAGWMAEHGLMVGDRVDVRQVIAGVRPE